MARLKDISKEEFSIKGINQFYTIDLETFFEGKKLKLITSSVTNGLIRLMIEVEKDLKDDNQSNVGKVFYVRIPLNKGIKEDHMMTVDLLKGGHEFKYEYLNNIATESIVNNVLYITAESTKLKKTDGTMISISRTGIYDEEEKEEKPENELMKTARKLVKSQTRIVNKKQ